MTKIQASTVSLYICPGRHFFWAVSASPSHRWGCDSSSQPPWHTPALSSPLFSHVGLPPSMRAQHGCTTRQTTPEQTLPLSQLVANPLQHKSPQLFHSSWKDDSRCCEEDVPHVFFSCFLSWKDLVSYYFQSGCGFSLLIFYSRNSVLVHVEEFGQRAGLVRDWEHAGEKIIPS